MRWERPRNIVLIDAKPILKGRFTGITRAGKVLGIRIHLSFSQSTVSEPVVFECQEDYFFDTLGITKAESIIKCFRWSASHELKQRLRGKGVKIKLPKTLPILEFSPGDMNIAFSG